MKDLPMQKQMRLRQDSGIAIGVILFVIAIIAAISIALGAGNVFTGSIITPDRVTANIKSQGLLIIQKIRECRGNGFENEKLRCYPKCAVYAPLNGILNCSPVAATDASCQTIDENSFYSTSTGNGTAVASLVCPSFGAGANNLWTGQSPTPLPPPTSGFDAWYYVDASGTGGGRCIRTQPLPANANDAGIKSGIANTASSFTSAEMTYDPNSASQRFILWITPPTGTPDPNCSP